VLTHTSPGPPPAAGAAIAVAAVLVFVELVVVAGAAEGDVLTELVGLKKSARVFFAGDGDGVTSGETAAAVFALRVRLAAGEGDAAASAAGEAALVATAFLWERCFAGEGDGD